MSDSPQTDAFILPATEKNYERLLESHGRLERDHEVLLAVSKALRAYLLDLDRFKGDVPDEIWEPFDAAISADTV